MPQTSFPITTTNTAGGNSSAQITFSADVADQLAKLQFSYGPEGWRYDVTTAQNEWLEAGLDPNAVASRVLSLVPEYITPETVGPENLYSSFADFFGQVETIDIGEVVERENSEPVGSVRIVEPNGNAADILAAGQLLFVDENDVSDADGINLASKRYQWLRDGIAVDGADGDNFLLSFEDIGSTISVEYYYIDGFFTAEAVVSSESSIVLAEIPEPPVVGLNIVGDDFRNGLFGTDGNDTILGLGQEDVLEGRAGDDQIDGGSGLDISVYFGVQSMYTLVLDETGVDLEDRRSDGDGTDRLVNVELLEFLGTGRGVAFDLEQFGGPAGLSASDFESFIELYIAYFNRSPDAIGLNFWGTAFANGTTLEEMAALFVDQEETRATYPEGTTNAEFVEAVYNNVIGRGSDQAGFDFWVPVLDDNTNGIGRDTFIYEFLQGVQDGSPDRAFLDNKVDIGAYFAVHRGMSDVDNAAAAMALFDGSQSSISEAVAAIDGFYQDALDPNNGEFLMQVVGVLDNPFAV